MTTTASTPTGTHLEIRELTPRMTACVRIRVAPDKLAAAFPTYLPQIAARVSQLGGSIAGPPYARYFRWDWDGVEVEIGAPIAALLPDLPEVVLANRGEVAGSELPGGRAAILVHTGPYGQLGDSWRRMEELMAERHLLSAGCGWEHYPDDPGIVPQEELRTELVHPIV